MGAIKLLSKEIVDKIAAGEVIVNGASVVKELVENSIDAASTLIKIAVFCGGKKSIEVSDNGCGIAAEDIENAFLRNATSKIENSIDNISSLGFRGEALASISCVSKITITTKTASADTGISADIVDSKIVSRKNVAKNTGTDILINDLFYNIPVRYKHLENDSAETTKIIDIVSRLAASKPHISFVLTCDGREIFTTDGSGNIKNTLSVIFGREKLNKMVYVDFADEPLIVKGFITSASYINNRPNIRVSVLNGRYIESKGISKVVDAVYSEISGKTGADYILYVELPVSMIDVNVHPSKVNVHFLNESLIMMLIKQGIKEQLSSGFKIREIEIKKSYSFIAPQTEQKVFEEVKDYFSEKTIKTETEPFQPIELKNSFSFADGKPEIKEPPKEISENKATNKEFSVDLSAHDEAKELDRSLIKQIALMKYVGNAFGVYALFETEKFLYAVDTHAAHERVLYEKYLESYKNKSISVQQLLIPVTVTLSPRDYTVILNNAENLAALGFETDDFGDNTIAVRSIPDFTDNDKIPEFISMLPSELTNITTAEDFKQRSDLLIKRACHNAIRGKMYIPEKEARALLDELSLTKMPYTCPHGRQIIGKIDIRYFMKVFDRI